MEEKRTIPLPAEAPDAGRERTIAIVAGSVVAVAVAVVSVVAVSGGSSSQPRRTAVGAAAATGSPTPYATDSAGGYSQQPQFTWSARAGLPPAPTSTPVSAPSSAPVADPPPSGQTTSPGQSTSVPASPPKSPSKPPASPSVTVAPPPPTTKPAATPYQISGTVSCVSGNSVEGVWVQADQGSGYSPWQAIGNGSTSRYWYTLPSAISFSLHVGCGGTTSSWGVALTTSQTAGPVADFTCHDVSLQADYGTCELQ